MSLSYSAALELYDDGVRGEPKRYTRAHVIFGHALLIGALVGVPIGQARYVLDAVAKRDKPSLTSTEIRDLRVTLEAVGRAIDMAITASGTPTADDAGRALAGSDLVKTDENGALLMAIPQMPVTVVRREIAEIIRMLDAANAPSAKLRYLQT